MEGNIRGVNAKVKYDNPDDRARDGKNNRRAGSFDKAGTGRVEARQYIRQIKNRRNPGILK